MLLCVQMDIKTCKKDSYRAIKKYKLSFETFPNPSWPKEYQSESILKLVFRSEFPVFRITR